MSAMPNDAGSYPEATKNLYHCFCDYFYAIDV